ncbi:Acyl-CoA dehydrogenase [Actinokineospora alba]|uniref:Acyl-CoA dehydrogenase n=1 Tax=Actinokineospora alba TaxID=504798 RepID=A0A1H0EQZ5_9PSEU|nr:acyl-CoA dehydrogenase [Actinokineospora alba]TDP69188.1 alkylation response protein AidB-like acyl-CoA dehydrogenase [Actinokineospora alba]SDI22335.1 Acyl-CoA dehydrogenase [Actinokineospora alba]SDN84765.1 Acyl-CoA dehydrogenase [Actinokineospora alba]
MAPTGYELGLGLSEEHLALADSVRGFADRHLTADVLRAAVDAKAESLPPFWGELAGQGLLGLHVPEEHGGQGAGLLELAVALEALGRAAQPGPLLPTVLASALMVAADAKVGAELLPGLADGSRTAGVGLADPLDGRETGDGLVVSGSTVGVLGGAVADVLVLPVRLSSGVRWVVLDKTDLKVREQDSMDVIRRCALVEATGVAVPAERVLDGLTAERVRSIAAVLLGAEAVGIASWCVSTAAEYAKVRVQFGRPIGQFQGVKHKCAAMGIELERARAVVWDAARALDSQVEPAAADFAAAVAAVVAPDAAVRCGADCIQVLGGIGFTWEHDAHLYYRRALSLRGLLGRSTEWADSVARSALSGVTRPVAIDLPEGSEAIRESVRAELAEVAVLSAEDQLVALGDGGWVQPHLPRPYGRAAGPLEQVVIGEEIKRAGIQLPELLMGGWAVPPIVAYGTEEQKQRVVVPTLRGEIVWCQLFSEPGAGSDLASLTTKAERVDGGWKINGQKIWTTVAQFSDWAMLIARTDPAAPKHEGITYFILDMTTPGVTVRPLREATGSALFNEVFLDDVFVPDDCVVGEINDGWTVARATLSSERVALGRGNASYPTLADLLRFAAGRDLDATAIHRIGEFVCENQVLDLLGARTVLKQLSGADVSTTSSVGKFLSMRFGQQIAEFCLAELGVAGVVAVKGEPSDKWMDQVIACRAMTIYGGTTEVQLNVIGERMLSLPRDADR